MTNPGITAGAAVGSVLVAAGTIATVAALAVPIAGFGVGGVVAGSAAAAAQSAIYGGATCGVFSVLQSIGATLVWVPVASGGAITTCAGVATLKS